METVSTDIGMNKTGVMMSPIDSTKSAEGAVELTTPPEGDASAFSENRIRYMKEAEPIGTLPMPGSVKGAVSAIQEKIMNGSHTFMDKLGERIAFERTGTRLYEALLSKYQGTEDKSSLPQIERIEQFYLEEMKHFQMVSEVMVKIGGDPTAVTPAADVAGVAAMGWVQVITDPRTTFQQSLETILQAELVDNAGWEVLIELAEGAGLSDIATQFQVALDEETIHLQTVKDWVMQLNLNGGITKGLSEEGLH
jgi:rubrerythrin